MMLTTVFHDFLWITCRSMLQLKRLNTLKTSGHLSPLLTHQLAATSRPTRPTGTTGRPLSGSSRASSHPPSLVGSWAGITTTGTATPWSASWLSWPSETAAHVPPPLLCRTELKCLREETFFFLTTFCSKRYKLLFFFYSIRDDTAQLRFTRCDVTPLDPPPCCAYTW